MSSQALAARSELPGNISVPPLESGDHLSRDEFQRRYAAMPHLKKAELIEGIVYMAPAVRLTYHAGPHADLITWLGVYRAATPGVQTGDNATVRLDLNNEPQPDAVLLIDPGHGGQSRLSDDNYIEGAPELVAEISASTASIDLNAKRQVYRRNGVREYIAWRVIERAIDWFMLRDGEYARLAQDANGWLRSETFPGLWLDADAMIRGDLSRVLQVVQQGIATGGHAAFTDSFKTA